MPETPVEKPLAEQLAEFRLMSEHEFIQKAEKLVGSDASPELPRDLMEFALRMDKERKRDAMFDRKGYTVPARVEYGKQSMGVITEHYTAGHRKATQSNAVRAALWAFTAALEAEKNPK